MIKNSFLKIFLAIVSVILISSCSNEKKLVYFQKTKGFTDTLDLAKVYIPKIQPGDILSIYVNSLNPEASSFFNPYSVSASSGGTSSASSGSAVLSQSAAPGYLVNSSGVIQLPLIGNLKISGLSTTQASDTIKVLVSKYLKEPTVNVRFLNYRISVLGEVAKPSIYTIPNEMITLPEALSLAGDLTVFARRDSITIVRDMNGKKVFGNVDLRGRDVFNSPYYYLHANDVIYVKTGKAKAQSIDRTYQVIPIVVSLLTLILYIVRR
ncbi:polysaccharide biosynthesis/export family protein [Mucilaginibacter lappiensis]|uniref:Polysaccharide export outer membrane protein n=1 Tax=Mucilaginibacter lappiensis TaxID=354630 RepID=A0A1N7CJ83_9SPHI|nr:polysaccharide biosynthesis/export family protein [Mucilaginibacter lappiensis]MBB6110787.1 polysaccharide export outer membrane protein [Mucilaginibacter lappiensis]MBB6128167.1 polysaccharide export outer membrane protein [Mucilaginibacter lappiensis]SIR63708.1 polysaccharide export outer membrane protein [Mucilaginibacter lappiensis]